MNKKQAEAKLMQLSEKFSELTNEIGERGYSVVCLISLSVATNDEDAILTSLHTKVNARQETFHGMVKNQFETLMEAGIGIESAINDEIKKRANSN